MLRYGFMAGSKASEAYPNAPPLMLTSKEYLWVYMHDTGVYSVIISHKCLVSMSYTERQPTTKPTKLRNTAR